MQYNGIKHYSNVVIAVRYDMPEVIIRKATRADKAEITSFTRNTWEWGDYIPSVINFWLREKDGMVLVADIGGRPVGMLHVKFLPDHSAWFEGLRVHPLYRRRGIAYKLNLSALEMLKEMGIGRVRLVIESSNKPSLNLATKLGFRKISEWIALEIKQSKIENRLTNCVIRIKMDEVWDVVKESEIYKLSNGVMPVRWRWIKIDKDVLRIILSRKKWLRRIRCIEKLGLFAEMGYGTLLCFSNAENKEELIRLLKGIKNLVRTHKSKVFEIQLPKGHKLAEEIKEISSDVTTFFVFEKGV